MGLTASSLMLPETKKSMMSVLEANGEFTKNLYKILAKQPGNVFFSPISIHAILSLASQGSASQTTEAFTKVLNIPDVRLTAKGYKEVMTRLNSVKDVTLLMANKVYLKENYKLQKVFNSAAKQFLSEVQLLDFEKGDTAAKTINSWVEQKTNKKIKDIISAQDLTVDTRLVLVNAIYFKGKWAEQFSPSRTTTEKFYVNDSDIIDIQMMHITKEFFFKKDDDLDAKVLELPYVNKAISLIVILPNQKNGITKLEKKLAGTDLTKISENMYRRDVQVSLPKFKIEQTIDLEQSLTEMGLGDIFSHNANFSGMIDSPEPLYVSKVLQKAFIEVNEEGTEAAAATGFEVMMCSLSLPTEFTVDHPFIIILQTRQEDRTTALFLGRVYEPKDQLEP